MSNVTGKDSLLLKLLGSSFAIFAGVAMALAADDWRLGREDAQEAEESLTLMAADLRLDSTYFETYASTMATHGEAAGWLLLNWDNRNASVDSIEAYAFSIFAGGLPSFSRATFDGLSNSNRIRLIDDTAIQDGIRAYYGRTQPNLVDFWDFTFAKGLVALELLGLHVQQPMDAEDGTLWPFPEERVTLRHPWSEITEDIALEATLRQYGLMAQFMASSFIEARDEATELLLRIEGSPSP